MPLGLYISVPFCRTKCTYCNFASDVFSRAVFQKYVDRVCDEISRADQSAEAVGGRFERTVDSIYFGGGTPTLLDVAQLERIFVNVRQNFELRPDVEITVECAPGTLSQDVIAALVRCGVNRVSLGVQSFVDREAASVGRLHKRDVVLDDIARLRNAGISNINVDLIAGLPHQTQESWEYSLNELIASGVPHASVYMLEVDEDSRLGRELMAGGQKYHAHFVPDDDLTADMYEVACDRLNAAGIQQYEISNFARGGFEAKHNLKYWTRQPYLGFGVDAHSMLASTNVNGAVRFSNPDALEKYVASNPPTISLIDSDAELEEVFFLGLRLNRGVDLAQLKNNFGKSAIASYMESISELVGAGLLVRENDVVRLTAPGRLLSNEVFERFISASSAL
ncbi:MAG: coproporphyrinogen III oxidase [Acidobacteria bacterium]|nr:MAG: coproporphyrinogen III oxidase [Acidobacteriota bacterium]